MKGPLEWPNLSLRWGRGVLFGIPPFDPRGSEYFMCLIYPSGRGRGVLLVISPLGTFFPKFGCEGTSGVPNLSLRRGGEGVFLGTPPLRPTEAKNS